MARTYTEQQRTDALAALLLNNGNFKRTALQLGIPRATLQLWRASQLSMPEVAGTETEVEQTGEVDLAARWRETMLKALARADQLLAISEDLKAVAVLAGIAADKHLDFAEGRKGINVNVDNRTQNLNVRAPFAITIVEVADRGDDDNTGRGGHDAPAGT